MWIRSQDKKSLMDVCSFNIHVQSKRKTIIWAYTNGTAQIELGSYPDLKTAELELDAIHEAIDSNPNTVYVMK